MGIQLFQHIIIVLLVRNVFTQEMPQGCVKEEFRCSDGTCIPDHFLCNGVKDCNNGLDEFICIDRSGLGCPPHMVECGGSNPNECIDQEHWCDGISHCSNGEDEASCQLRPDSPCMISQFECPQLRDISGNSSVTECVPLAHRCNGNRDCANSGDEIGCSPPVIIVQPTRIINAFDGSSPSLLCTAEGTPTPTITWYRNLLPLDADPRYVMVSENGTGVLVIMNATVFDQGSYSCVATNPIETVTAENRTNLQIFNDDPFTCDIADGGQFPEGTNYYFTEILTFGEASSAAADVVFVVDESGSMQDAHEWIRNAVPLLEQAFKDRGIGVGTRKNMFALVGFGRNVMPDNEGIVLTDLTSVDGFVNASYDLVTDGLFEDGYSGIEVALDRISLRRESVRLLVFISNEPRQELTNKESLNRTNIEQRLRENDFTFNAIVSQGLLYNSSDSQSYAFALDSNGTAYTFLSQTEFTTHPNGIPNPDPFLTEGTTYEDYTRLALDLGGAVFDIQQIQPGNTILNPFTEAFIDIKVEEVMGVSKRCFKCLCRQPEAQCSIDNSISIDNCSGIAPPDASLVVKVFPIDSQVIEGGILTLTCETSVSPPNTPVQINWRFMGIIQVDICGTGMAECTGNTAIIRDFMRSNGGFYTCEGVTSTISQTDLTRIEFISPPIATITDTPVDGRVSVGKPLFLTCSATGVPSPWIIWRRGGNEGDMTMLDMDRVQIQVLQQGDTVMSELVIDPALTSDSGSYECVAINSVGSDNDTATITVSVSECTLSDGTVLSPGESKVIFSISNGSRAADVVLVVDESGSMEMEHEWIINTTRRLDELLLALDIGKNIPNRFGVVGYGSYEEDYTNGRIVQYNGMSFVSASEVANLINMLRESGRYEDGYLALKFAFENYQFRENVARQFILITDEERDIIDNTLNKTAILDLLRGSPLAVVVSEGFENTENLPALGMDALSNTYIYDPLSPGLIRVSVGGRPIPDSAYVTTNQDYTTLALASQGSAWNLLLLRQGGSVAEAFTEGFVMSTIEEIYTRISQCLNCTCDAFDGTVCVRMTEYSDVPECNVTKVLLSVIPDMPRPSPSISVDVTPSILRLVSGFSDARLVCSIKEGQGVFAWTLNGGQLPSNVDVSSTRDTSVLSIQTVNYEQHNGRYTCLVREGNAVGSDMAIMDIRMLQSPLGVEVVYPEVTIVVGQNVSFRCSSSELATFEWHFNDMAPLPSNAVIETTSQQYSILTITDSMKTNQGRYFCTGRDTTNNLIVDKDYGKLYIITPILKLSLTPSPSIIADTGSNISLVCELDCVCVDARLTWKRGFNGTLPSNAQVIYNADQTQAILNLYNVRTQDCDLYTCLGEFRNQEETLGTQVILRDVVDFEVMLNTGSNITVEVGSNQSFICNSTSEVSMWQWFFNDGLDLPIGIEVFDLSSNRTMLFICDVQSFHVGAYKCEGTSIDGIEVDSDVTTIHRVIGGDEIVSPSTVTTSVTSFSDSPGGGDMIIIETSETNPGTTLGPGTSSLGPSTLSLGPGTSSLGPGTSSLSSISMSPFTTSNVFSMSNGPSSSQAIGDSSRAGDPSSSLGSSRSNPGGQSSTSAGNPSSPGPSNSPGPSSNPGGSSSSSGGPSSSPGDPSSSPGGPSTSTINSGTSSMVLNVTNASSNSPSTTALSQSLPVLTPTPVESFTSSQAKDHSPSGYTKSFTTYKKISETSIVMVTSTVRTSNIVRTSTSSTESVPLLSTRAGADETLESSTDMLFTPDTITRPSVSLSDSDMLSTIESAIISESSSLDLLSPIITLATDFFTDMLSTSESVILSATTTKSIATSSDMLSTSESVILSATTTESIATSSDMLSTTESVTTASTPMSSNIISTSESSSSTSTSSSTTTFMPIQTMILTTPRVSVTELNLSPGDNANITCTTNTPASITWIFDSGDLPRNIRVIIVNATAALLVITDFNGQSNQGSYRCLASAGIIDEIGVVVPVNTIEMLSIIITPDTIAPKTPNDMLVDDNQVKVVCRLACMCGGAQVRWERSNGGPLPAGVTTTTIPSKRVSTLIFTSTSLDNSGNYTCIASSNSQIDVIQKVFTIDVLPDAELSVTPSETTVDAGDDVRLICKANRAVQNFKWTYKSDIGDLPSSAVVLSTNSTVSLLVITDIRRDVNDGQYFCQGMFEVTSEETSVTGNIVLRTDLVLAVESTPPMPAADGIYRFSVGDTIGISCEVFCPCGGARAQWSEPSVLPAGLRIVNTSNSGRTQSLSTDSAQLQHTGSYVCRVFNRDDSISTSVQIIVT